MDNQVIFALADDNREMSDVDRLVNLYHLLSQVLIFGVPGVVAEFGCHAGKTSVFLRKIIDCFAADRPLHVFDSFVGLPEPGPRDAYLRGGDCAASRADLLATFARWSAKPPVVHEGWFDQTLPSALPEAIAFAYVDADFYDSTRTVLDHVYPRLSPGGVLCLDDYADADRNPRAWQGLPGVKAACDDYFADKSDRVHVLVGSGDLAFGVVRKGVSCPATIPTTF
jgi:O-methyltransferase